MPNLDLVNVHVNMYIYKFAKNYALQSKIIIWKAQGVPQ